MYDIVTQTIPGTSVEPHNRPHQNGGDISRVSLVLRNTGRGTYLQEYQNSNLPGCTNIVVTLGEDSSTIAYWNTYTK